MVKFTEEDILKIRELSKIKNYTEIAKLYNTSSSYIGTIINKKSWKHI